MRGKTPVLEPPRFPKKPYDAVRSDVPRAMDDMEVMLINCNARVR
jgi:hypothetical protein